jgi:hypothetical protein
LPKLIDTRVSLSATADKTARIVKDKNGISAAQQEALWGNKAAGRPHKRGGFFRFQKRRELRRKTSVSWRDITDALGVMAERLGPVRAARSGARLPVLRRRRHLASA